MTWLTLYLLIGLVVAIYMHDQLLWMLKHLPEHPDFIEFREAIRAAEDNPLALFLAVIVLLTIWCLLWPAILMLICDNDRF